jgi:hypothetical protein
LTTPFGRLTEGPVGVETASSKDPALLALKVASSKTGILSTSVELHVDKKILIMGFVLKDGGRNSKFSTYYSKQLD